MASPNIKTLNTDEPRALSEAEGLVSISQTAQILGVSIDTVRRWDKNGTLHSTRPDGKNRYFSIKELESIKFAQPMTISEVAEQLNVSPSTLRRLETKGLISPERNNKGERVYDRKALEGFLRSEYFIRQKEVEEEILKPLNGGTDTNGDEPKQNGNGHHDPTTHAILGEHHVNIASLKKFKKIFLTSLLVIVGSFLILITIITLMFFLFPTGSSKTFGYYKKDPTNKHFVFQDPPSWVARQLRPFSKSALQVVDAINPDLRKKIAPNEAIADVNDIFQPDSNGNVKSVYTFTVPDSSYLVIPDTGLVKNLNSEFVQGREPGCEKGNIAIVGACSTTTNGGGSTVIVNGTTTGSGGGSGTITEVIAGTGLNGGGSSGSVTLNVGEGDGITIATDTISLKLNSSGSGLEVGAPGLSLNRTCASGQILKWNGSGWACAADSAGASALVVQEAGSTVVPAADTLNYTGSDFNVSASGNTANISIDYTNSKITREDQTQTITGTWTFTDATTVFQDNLDNTKKLNFDLSNIASGTTRTLNVPNTSGTIITSGNLVDINAVGTITSGVWQGSTLAVQYGGTGQTTYTDGDLLIGDSAGNTLSKAKLTAGSGVTITNGNGSITISATGAGTCPTCANQALSNLSSVAINTSLLTGNGSVDLGSNTNPFRDLYLGGSSSNNFKFTGTATAARQINIPDASGTLAVSASGNIALSSAGDITFTGVLPVASGGTGANNLTTNGLLLGNGTSAISATAAGTSGQLLVANVAGVPTFVTLSGDGTLVASGTLTLANTGVSAGTYGSATQVPVFTVDSKGRLSAVTNTTIAGVTPGGSAGGDLSGTYPNPTVAKINGNTLGDTTPTAGNLLVGSGTDWVSKAITGDLSVTSSGVASINADAVALGTDTTGNYVAGFTAGNGLSGDASGEASNPTLSVNTGNGVQVVSDAVTLALQSNKGLEVDGNGLSLIDCATGQILKYNAGNQWACAADDNATSTSFIDSTFRLQDNTDTSKQIAFEASGIAPGTTRTFTAPNADGTLISTGNLTDINAVGTITSGIWQGSTLGVQYGGTGTTSLTSNGVLYGNGTGAVQASAAGTSGQLLVANASGVPTFVSASGDATLAASGALTLANTAVSAATYGSATQVGQFTVDAKGRLTFAGNVTISGTTPGGSAGGDLSGTYPNPTVARINGTALGSTTATAGNLLVANGSSWVSQAITGDLTVNSSGVTTLANSGVTAATYGTASSVPTITFDAKGRATAASNTAIAIDAGQITSGILGVPRGGTGTNTFTANGLVYGNGTSALQVSAAGTSGQLPVANVSGVPTFVTISNDATLAASGALTLKNTGTAGTYGSASQVSVFVTDAQGRVTSATNTAIALDASAITSGTLAVNRGGTGQSTYADGQLLIGNTASGGLTKATLTAGSGISITNGNGSITIANTASTPTLQQTYNASTNPEIVVNSTNGALTIRDNATPLGANLFEIQNNSGSTNYLAVTATGTSVAGTLTSSGALTVSGGGASITGGLNNNNGGITNAGAISGGTGITSSGTITFSGLSTAGIVHNNASGTLSTSAVNLANSDVSGILPVANGGTNTNSIGAAGTVAFSNGSAYNFTAVGTANQLLTSQGTGTPTFQNIVSLLTAGSNIVLSGTTNATIAVSSTPSFTTVNGLTLTSQTDGFTVAGGTTSRTLTVTGADITVGSTIKPTSSGGLTLTTTGNTNGLTLNTATGASGNSGSITIQTGGTTTSGTSGNVSIDTGVGATSNGTISIGTANASALNLSRSGIATTVNGSLTVGQGATLNGGATIAANQNLTLASGTGQFIQNYSNTSSGSAQVLTFTNANTTAASRTVNGLDITLSNATNTNNSDTVNGISLAASNNNSNVINGLSFGSGFTNLLSSPSITINGSGVISGATGLSSSGTITFSGLNSVGIVHNNASGVLSTSAVDLSNGDVTGTLPVNRGGTGQTTYTDGQLLIGNTATAGLTKATLTAGSGVTITNGNGSITVAAPNAGTCATCANTALSNLGSVAINTSLLSGASTIDLGSSTNPFRDLYLGGSATNNIKFSGVATAPRTITVPDAGGTLAVSASGNIALSAAGNISFSGTLPIASGGTNATTIGSAGSIIYSNGASYNSTTAGTTNQILTSQGTGTPTFQNVASLLTAGTNIAISGTTNATVATVNNPTFTTSVTTPTLTNSGALTVSSGTNSDLTIDAGGTGKTILADATLNLSNGDTTLDLTGAATKTLTILNSTTSQVANLDLNDGALLTGGTSRLTNAGVLQNITGINMSSGNFVQTGTGTFDTGTGAVSLNGTTTVAAGKSLIITGGAGSPSLVNGTIWYDTSANKFKIVEGGTAKIVCNTTDSGCGTGGGSSALSSLTAATSINSINNGDYAQTWDWSLVTANATAFTFGENSASSGGSGSQYILGATTLGASTAAPFYASAHGNKIIDTTKDGGVTIGNTSAAQTVTIDAGVGTINLANSNSARTINVGTGTAVDTINIGTGGTSADLITIGASSNSWNITSGGAITTSGNFVQSGAATLSTGTGAVSLNGTVTVASGKALIITGGNGDPTATNGTIWYDTSTNKFKIVEGGTVKVVCNTTDAGCGTGGGGGSNVWSALTAPTTNLSLNHGEFTTTFTWDTNTTAASLNGLTLALTNDATTDNNTQRVLTVQDNNTTGGGTTENLVRFDHADADSTLASALQITSSGGGTITNGVDASGSNIVNAINVGGNTIAGTTGSINFSSYFQLTNNPISFAKFIGDGFYTGSAKITVSSGGTSDLVFNSASNTDVFDATDTAISATGLATLTSSTALNLNPNTGTSYTLDTSVATLALFGTPTTLNFAQNATTLNIATTGSLTRGINIGTGTGVDTISIATGNTAADSVIVGNAGVATTFEHRSGANGDTTSSALSLVDDSLTTGTGLYVKSGGTITSGGDLAVVVADSATSGNVLNLSGTGLISGKLITGTLGTGLTTGSALSLTSGKYAHTAGANETGNLANLSFTDNSSTNNTFTGTSNGLNVDATTTASPASGGTDVLNGINLATTFNSTSSNTGTKNINAMNIAQPTLTACTGGNCNWTGINVSLPATTASYTTKAAQITANSITTDTIFNIDASGLTAGKVININANGATALTSGAALNVVGNTGAAAISANSGLVKISAAGAFTTQTGAGSGGLLDIQGVSTTGTYASISSTAALTTTGNLLTIDASAATTATGLLTINAGALTQGYAQNINVNGTTSLTSGGALNIVGNTGAATVSANSGLVKISSAGAFTTQTGAGSGGLLDVQGVSTTGTYASISSTAALTTTGNLLTLDASSATTATGLLTVNAGALTQGYAQNINVNNASALTSGGALNVVGPTGAAAISANSGLVKISAAGALTTQTGAGSGGLLDIQGNAVVTGTLASISSTATMTTTGNLLTLDAANATTATGLLTLNAGALTQGYAANINVNGSTSLTQGGALNIVGNTGAAAISANSGLVKISAAGAFTTQTGAGSGGLLDVQGVSTTGTYASISSTANLTTTGNLMTLQADSATTATGLLTLSGTSLTQGFNQSIAAGTGLTTGGALNITGASYSHSTGADQIGSVAKLAFTETTQTANTFTSTSNGIDLTANVNVGGAATGTRNTNALTVESPILSCAAGTCNWRGLNVNLAAAVANTTQTGLLVTSSSATDTSIKVIANSLTTGTGESITSTGTLTTTGNLLTLTANNATTATGLVTLSGTGLTTGYSQSVAAGIAMTTGGALNVTGASYNHTAAETGSLLNLAVTDGTTLGTSSVNTTTNGLNFASTVNVTGTGSGTKTTNVLNLGAPSLACSASETCAWNGILQTLSANTASNITQTAVNVVADSATKDTLIKVSDTGQTSGTGLSITGGGANLLSSGKLIDLQMGAATTGNALNILNSGVYTGSGIINLTASSATTGTLVAINGSSLTSGVALSLNGGSSNQNASGRILNIVAGSATDGQAINILSTGTYTGGAGLMVLSATGLTTGAGVGVQVGAITTGVGLYVSQQGNATLQSNGVLIQAHMGAATAGTGLQAITTGAYTGSDGLLAITANSATSGTLAVVSGTSLTTGKALQVSGSTVLTSAGSSVGSLLNLSASTATSPVQFAHTAAETGNVAGINFQDSTSSTTAGLNTTTNGLNVTSAISVTGTGTGTKTINAINVAQPSLTCSASQTCVWDGLKINEGALPTSNSAQVTQNGLNVDYTQSYANSQTEQGNSLKINRNLTVTAGTLVLNGTLVDFASTCTNTSACTDSANILKVSQNNTNATGDGLIITQKGSGNALSISDGTNTTTTLTKAGVLTLGKASSTTNGQLVLAGNAGSGSGTTTIKIGSQGSTSITYTLPISQPAGTSFLSNDSTGVLTWSPSTATLGTISAATADQLAAQDSTTHAVVWNWSGVTTATGLSIGTSATTDSAYTSGGLLAVGDSHSVYVHTTTQTGSLQTISFTDKSATASISPTTNGLDINLTQQISAAVASLSPTDNGINIGSTINVTGGSGAATKTANAINVEAPTLTSCTGGSNACTWNGLNMTLAQQVSSFTQNGLNIGNSGDLSGITFSSTTTGVKMALAGLTESTTGLTQKIYGLDLSGGNLTNSTGTSTIDWRGLNITMPVLGGATSNSNLTADGIRITGAGVTNTLGVLNAINIAAITGSSGVENGIIFGTGYDNDITSTSGTAITINSGGTGTISIGTDSDSETLNLGSGAGGKAINLGSTTATSTLAIKVSSGTGLTINNGTQSGTGVTNSGTACTISAVVNGIVTTVTTCASDARLKTNVVDVSGALGKLEALRPVNYEFNNTYYQKFGGTPDGTHYGLIAQDVQQVFPDLIGTATGINGEDGSHYLTVNYSEFTSILIEGIKELDAKVNANAALASGGLQSLSDRVTQVENKTVGIDGQGNANFSGIVSASGLNAKDIIASDMGKQFNASEPITAGDVVALDPTAAETVKRSNSTYQQTVIGVVSEDAGLMLGQQTGDDSKATVAVSGTVSVKVSTEGGAIQAGDYLTSSNTPGVAMKASHAGSIIGKALSSYTDDTQVGKVMMLISTGETTGTLSQDLTNLSSQLAGLDQRVNNVESTNIQNLDLTQLKVGTLNVSLDINANGSLNVGAGLSVGGDATFHGLSFFEKMAVFFAHTVFRQDVEFLGRPTFNKDTAGFAQIKTGEQTVHINFVQAYDQTPVVSATVGNGKFASYAVNNVTTTGFDIVLQSPAQDNLTFNWIALSIKDAQTATNPTN